jgi:hypothetical protein
VEAVQQGGEAKPDFSKINILHYFAQLQQMAMSVLEMCPRKLTV